jgi:hypothetical protein
MSLVIFGCDACIGLWNVFTVAGSFPGATVRSKVRGLFDDVIQLVPLGLYLVDHLLDHVWIGGEAATQINPRHATTPVAWSPTLPCR